MISEALRRLGEVSAEYARRAQDYERVAREAAEAEASHRSARAKATLKFKASEDRMSMAEAETRAEADDEVSRLYRERLIAAAMADSAKARLAQLKEQVSVGRSWASAEREGDRLAATGGGP